MVIAGMTRVLNGRGPVAVSDGGLRGALPEKAGICPPARDIIGVRSAEKGQSGGSGVADGGHGWRAGAFGALGGPDQCRDGGLAGLSSIGIIGNGVQRVQVVPRDDVGDFLSIAGKRGAQMSGYRQVPGLAIPPDKVSYATCRNIC